MYARGPPGGPYRDPYPPRPTEPLPPLASRYGDRPEPYSAYRPAPPPAPYARGYAEQPAPKPPTRVIDYHNTSIPKQSYSINSTTSMGSERYSTSGQSLRSGLGKPASSYSYEHGSQARIASSKDSDIPSYKSTSADGLGQRPEIGRSSYPDVAPPRNAPTGLSYPYDSNSKYDYINRAGAEDPAKSRFPQQEFSRDTDIRISNYKAPGSGSFVPASSEKYDSRYMDDEDRSRPLKDTHSERGPAKESGYSSFINTSDLGDKLANYLSRKGDLLPDIDLAEIVAQVGSTKPSMSAGRDEFSNYSRGENNRSTAPAYQSNALSSAWSPKISTSNYEAQADGGFSADRGIVVQDTSKFLDAVKKEAYGSSTKYSGELGQYSRKSETRTPPSPEPKTLDYRLPAFSTQSQGWPDQPKATFPIADQRRNDRGHRDHPAADRHSPSPVQMLKEDKYTTAIYLGMEEAPDEFGAVQKVLGTDNENLDYVRQATGATVELRGEGTRRAPNKPLHIYIGHSSLTDMQEAERLAQSLVTIVQEEFKEWKASLPPKRKEEVSRNRMQGTLPYRQDPVLESTINRDIARDLQVLRQDQNRDQLRKEGPGHVHRALSPPECRPTPIQGKSEAELKQKEGFYQRQVLIRQAEDPGHPMKINRGPVQSIQKDPAEKGIVKQDANWQLKKDVVPIGLLPEDDLRLILHQKKKEQELERLVSKEAIAALASKTKISVEGNKRIVEDVGTKKTAKGPLAELQRNDEKKSSRTSTPKDRSRSVSRDRARRRSRSVDRSGRNRSRSKERSGRNRSRSLSPHGHHKSSKEVKSGHRSRSRDRKMSPTHKKSSRESERESRRGHMKEKTGHHRSRSRERSSRSMRSRSRDRHGRRSRSQDRRTRRPRSRERRHEVHSSSKDRHEVHSSSKDRHEGHSSSKDRHEGHGSSKDRHEGHSSSKDRHEGHSSSKDRHEEQRARSKERRHGKDPERKEDSRADHYSSKRDESRRKNEDSPSKHKREDPRNSLSKSEERPPHIESSKYPDDCADISDERLYSNSPLGSDFGRSPERRVDDRYDHEENRIASSNFHRYEEENREVDNEIPGLGNPMDFARNAVASHRDEMNMRDSRPQGNGPPDMDERDWFTRPPDFEDEFNDFISRDRPVNKVPEKPESEINLRPLRERKFAEKATNNNYLRKTLKTNEEEDLLRGMDERKLPEDGLIGEELDEALRTRDWAKMQEITISGKGSGEPFASVIWVLGDAQVYLAAQATAKHRDGANMGLYGTQVHWMGVPGLRISNVEMTVRERMNHLPLPDCLIVHVGTEDIPSDVHPESLKLKITTMLEGLREALPQARIFWSEITEQMAEEPSADVKVAMMRSYANEVAWDVTCNKMQGAGIVEHEAFINLTKEEYYRGNGVYVNERGAYLIMQTMRTAMTYHLHELRLKRMRNP